MPDADRFRKLSRRWSRMAEKVCEGHFDSASLADEVVKPLREEIADYGQGVLSFLKEASVHLRDIQKAPLFLANHDWSEEDRFIRDLVFTYIRRYRSNQRGINIAVSAYQDLVHSFRVGAYIERNLHEVLLQAYSRRIYDSNFVAQLLLFVETNPDMDSNAISQVLVEMDVPVNKNIDTIVAQIVRNGRMGRMRRIHSVPSKAISLNDDLLSLGSSK